MREKKYLVENTEIMEDWDYEKNKVIGLDPNIIVCGSHKKAYWKCKIHGESFYQTIRDRVRGQLACKKCYKERENKTLFTKYIKDKKVVAETHPHLVDEWIECENPFITPYNCLSGSSKKVLWKCKKCNGTYYAVISNRCRVGSSCPYCAGQKVLVGFNDLLTLDPQLCEEWSNKNVLSPSQVTIGSNKKVYWKCKVGHEDYFMSIKQKRNGQGCPVCAMQSQTSFPEQAIYYYIKSIFPDTINRYIMDEKYEIDIYIPSKKIGIEYNGYYSHKKKQDKDIAKKQFMENNGINLIVIKEFKFSEEQINADYYINERTTPKSLSNLIYKIINEVFNINNIIVDVADKTIKIKEQYLIQKKEKSIATLRPDLIEEWDYDKNGNITPEFVSVGAKTKYYWICPICKQSYLRTPYDKAHGGSCPRHKNKVIHKGYNDFESKYPSLIAKWDFSKNEIKPDSIYYNSTKIVNWKCSKGHEYKRSIAGEVRAKNCPICIGKVVLKGYNDLLSRNPNIVEEWDYSLNTIHPDEIYYRNQTLLINWKCKKCGYEWKSKVVNRKKCPNCSKNQKKAKKINVYRAVDLSLYGEFNDAKHLCFHFGLDYKNYSSTISISCTKKRRLFLKKYILRYEYDDEIKKN